MTKLPVESTLGVGLVSTVDTKEYFTLPVKEQATVEVTLEWTGTAFYGMSVDGGSSQSVREGDNSLTVTVPWARRPLSITVDPQEVLEPSTFTLTAKATSVVKDTDKDGLKDGQEVKRYKTNPLKKDTDGDGLKDKVEIKGTANKAYGKCPTNPKKKDSDKDGLNDRQEIKRYGTDPCDKDTDDGGASDGKEVKAGSDPLDPKSTPGRP